MAALNHMRLSAADFDAAISHDMFNLRWRQFLRRSDNLVVYHPRTGALLRHFDTPPLRCLALKSIYGKRHAGFRTLEDLISIEGLEVPPIGDNCRAAQRLEMAVALVERLRERCGVG